MKILTLIWETELNNFNDLSQVWAISFTERSDETISKWLWAKVPHKESYVGS
jgi:hypothetical protein